MDHKEPEAKNAAAPAWGGKRDGAGRPARFGTPMPQKTVRLPQEWVDALIAEFGSFQTAIETLAARHLEHQDK